MTGLKYAVLSLAFLACLDGSARRKNKKQQKAETVELGTNPMDTLSYALGMANTRGLAEYIISRMNVDTAYMAQFIEGFNATLTAEERKQQLAYSAGLQIRQQVEKQIIPALNQRIAGNDSTEMVNRALFAEGFRKTLAGDSTVMDLQQAEELSERELKLYHEQNTERKYSENRRAGEEFLEANARKDSVQTLPSGVQYKVLVQGNGEVPSATAKVKVNYEGRLVDGTVFDSSYKRQKPATFACNQVIKGWTDALTHMPVGSKWEIYIPQELAYGAREAGKIPPFSALIFTVELLEIEK